MKFITMHWIKRILKFSAGKLSAMGRLIALLICLMTSSYEVFSQENDGFIVDEIIAKVDNYIVLKSDLDKYYQDYLSNGGSPSQQTKCELLAVLIRNKLMMAKAEID